MSSPEQVLTVLRAELRAAGITYKALAERIKQYFTQQGWAMAAR